MNTKRHRRDRRSQGVLTLIALLWLHVPATAQVNIEELRQNGDEVGASGALAMELEAHSGNTDIKEFGVEGRLDYTRPSVTTFLLASTEFGWEQGQRFANEGLIHLRQGYRIRNRLLLEVFGQYNYDKTYLLDFRMLGGVGVRFRLFESRIVHLWQGTAYMLEYERLGGLPINPMHPVRTTANRWSNYLAARFTVNNRLSSAWTVYVQPQLNAMGDVRVLSDANLEIDLGGPLVLVFSFSMRYDSRTPSGVKSVDTTLENTLAVTF